MISTYYHIQTYSNFFILLSRKRIFSVRQHSQAPPSHASLTAALGIPIEAFKFGGDTLLKEATTLFNECLQWEKAGENALIVVHQVHAKKRNTKKLVLRQPMEQTGYRSGFSDEKFD